MSWPVRTDNMLVINCCLRILRMFIIRRCPLFPFYPVLFCALIFLDVYLSIIHCCFDICGNTYIPDVFPFCYWLLSYSRRENAVWGVGLALFQSQRKTMSDVFVFPGDVGDMLLFQKHGAIIIRQFEFLRRSSLVTVQHWFYHQKPSIINTFSFTSHVQRWLFLRSVPAENSLLRFASEDKTPGEDFLLGRSLSQNRRKTDRGGGSTHYTLIPALQMEVSTSSSDSASLYHVSTPPPKFWPNPLLSPRHIVIVSRLHRRCLNDPQWGQGQRKRAKVRGSDGGFRAERVVCLETFWTFSVACSWKPRVFHQ